MAASAAQIAKAAGDPVADAHVILLEFREDRQTTVHRAAVNNDDVVSNGETYTATDISVTLPGASDQSPAVRIDMSNLSRVIGRAVNLARNRIGCRLLLVDMSDPDTLIMDTKNLFVLRSANGDSVRISAELGLRGDLQEPVPAQRTTRPFFAGLWFLAK